ncbi:hypothetical protein PIB30_038072 [Stylosanthes scabra]|uniref:Uncharacterized protein n=1 Tax=Stylosanthes scabra TaxID=79078 RepID=A0ABU6XFF5_9FABA|nr:hypothetical protein [Stylosanthes scabra]
MKFIREVLLLLVTIIVLRSSIAFAREFGNSNHVKTATFYTKEFELELGKVARESFFDAEFPRGHIGIKNFQVELVDEHRNPIPLYEAYLHHYFVLKYFENVTMAHHANENDPIYELPDPFRVEVGMHPEDVPKEYDEKKWLFDILAIDTVVHKTKKVALNADATFTMSQVNTW